MCKKVFLRYKRNRRFRFAYPLKFYISKNKKGGIKRSKIKAEWKKLNNRKFLTNNQIIREGVIGETVGFP